MSGDLMVVRDGDVQTFTIARPGSGNSLSAPLVEALHAALDAFKQTGGQVLILRGEGRNFCTGFDLGDIENSSDPELLSRFIRIEQLLARIWALPHATIAVATGRVMGAGADLFAACRCRIAVPDASFAFPGAAFGLILGSRRLARRIGEGQALHFVASGETIGASAAYNIGLVTALIAPQEVELRLEQEIGEGRRLDPETYRAVIDALGDEASLIDRDLAALVRSAIRPGLRDRIINYRERTLRVHQSVASD